MTRIALGYPQQNEFAAACGYSANVYNPWETGARTIPLHAAQRLQKKFGIPPEWLYEGHPDRLTHGLAAKLFAMGAPSDAWQPPAP